PASSAPSRRAFASLSLLRPGSFRRSVGSIRSRCHRQDMSRLPCRLQGVGDEVRGDLSAHLVSNDQRVAEVDASPDADLPLVLGELRNARELPGQAWVHEIADGEGDRARAEYGLE